VLALRLNLSSTFPRRACGTLVAVAVSASLAACGGSDAPSSAATAESIGFHANRKTYALPLNQLRAIDDGSVGYATNLLVKDCMEKAGFAWPIPAFDPTVRPPATWNSTGRRLFDVEIAERYGYHLAPPTNAAAMQQAIALNSQPLSAAEDRQAIRCRSAVQRQIAPPESRLVDSLAGAAYDAALSEDDTIAAGRRWASCLAPEGISDLPDMPNRMPSPSVAKRFHLGRAGGQASSAEIKIATADARCRESSGYAETLYNAEVDQQLTLFAKNRDALERTRAAARRNVAHARAIVAQHGA
jgi:hypothetical protein